ncbi:MAG: hypothetical protein EPO30_11820, partial [Lysobacteraceae bacterium]
MDLNPPSVDFAPPLHVIALATCAPGGEAGSAPEAAWLRAQRDALEAGGAHLEHWIAHWRKAPPPQDARLRALADAWHLSSAEVIAVALGCAAETDAMIGRVLAWLQAPVGGARPTLGLLATLAARFGEPAALAALAGGAARESGLIQFNAEPRALPEASLAVPLPIVFALADPASRLAPQRVHIGLAAPLALPPSLREAARSRARALSSAAG